MTSRAGAETEAITKARLEEAVGWFDVNSSNFPKVWEALDSISHDCGAGAGHEHYAVPEQLSYLLPAIEVALMTLMPEDFQEFAIGDQDLAEDMIKRNPALKPAHDFLNAFFDDWNVTLK